MISMTLPQSKRREVSVNGRTVTLSPNEHKLVELLLLRGDALTSLGGAIEYIWPNPDLEPEWAFNIVTVLIYRTRKKGVPIETFHGRGYSIWQGEAIRIAA